MKSKGQGPGWLELSEMTEQPDYDWEAFVNKADQTLLTPEARKSLSDCKYRLFG